MTKGDRARAAELAEAEMHRRSLEVQLYRLQHPHAASLSVTEPELHAAAAAAAAAAASAAAAESELEVDTEVASTEGYNADLESMDESVHAHAHHARSEPCFQGGGAPSAPRLPELQSLRVGETDAAAAAAAAARDPSSTNHTQTAARVGDPRL